MASFFGMGGGKTFKKKKTKGEEIKPAFSLASLRAGNMADFVRLPEGEDQNEWLAVHVNDFFNLTNIIFGTLTEFCTADSCPVMGAGANYEYLWAEGRKKATKVSAPEYMDLLMIWVESQLSDNAIFPSNVSDPFPKNFEDVCRNIMKRLFRVYAHIYHDHLATVQQLQEEAHLNTTFMHFYSFAVEFNLIDRKELEVLSSVYDELVENGR